MQVFTVVGRDGVALVCVAEGAAMHHFGHQIGHGGVGLPTYRVAKNGSLMIHLQFILMTGQLFQHKYHRTGPGIASGFQICGMMRLQLLVGKNFTLYHLFLALQ
jgi:hypothetical protein